MTNLVYLDVSFSDFSELTAQFDLLTKLPNLQTLKFSNSTLFRTIPEDVNEFTNLRELYFDNCNLEKIPESICQCKTLEKLIISGNKLAEIPDCVFSLPNLKELDIRNNPLLKNEQSDLLLKKIKEVTNQKLLNIIY